MCFAWFERRDSGRREQPRGGLRPRGLVSQKAVWGDVTPTWSGGCQVWKSSEPSKIEGLSSQSIVLGKGSASDFPANATRTVRLELAGMRVGVQDAFPATSPCGVPGR